MSSDKNCDGCKYYEPIVHNGSNEMACVRWNAYHGTNIVKNSIRFPMCIKHGWRELTYIDKQNKGE
jgi:hypothetical protein